MDAPSPTPSSSTYASALSGDEQDDLSNAMNLLALRQGSVEQNVEAPSSSSSKSISESSAVKLEFGEADFSYSTAPPLNRSVSAPMVPKGDIALENDDVEEAAKVDSTSQSSQRQAPAQNRTAVIFQEACLKHRYTRNSDSLYIVERPERLRAVKQGVAAAWARLEQRDSHKYPDPPLAASLSQLDLGSSKKRDVLGGPFDILFTDKVAPVDHPAIAFTHPSPNVPPADYTPVAATARVPDSLFETPIKGHAPLDSVPASAPSKLASPSTIENDNWPRQLQRLCREAGETVKRAPLYSEIPGHLPQGDLYLATDGGSEEAIFGAVGAVCEAVDRVVEGTQTGQGHDRAFVAIRPPGHHCCETNPMGFCFVCNVAIAAAHAHINHGIDRIVVVDIDLHHGNGTQEIAWRINDAASKAVASLGSPRKGSPKKTPTRKRPLQIMYSSLHDIYSYPCEDGEMSMVQAASLNVSGGHGQWIANVHLQKWQNETEFHERLYLKYLAGLLDPAAAFCEHSLYPSDEPDPSKTLVLLSAGFDASEHESAGMSRHAHNVPTSFYHRFGRDIAKFANDHAAGKVVAVLEGGYSDRALCSGTMALLVGMSESPRPHEKTFVNESGETSWWSKPSLDKIDKAVSAAAALSQSALGRRKDEPSWLARTRDVFAKIESVTPPSSASSLATPSGRRVTATPGTATRNAATGAGMTLRERKSRTTLSTSHSTPSTPNARKMMNKDAAATPVPRSAHPLSRQQQQQPPQPSHPPVPPLPPQLVVDDGNGPATATDEAATAMRRDESDNGNQPVINFTWRAGGIH